jgi:hypothetical protein
VGLFSGDRATNAARADRLLADSRGIELRTLRREGIPLLGCSPLIEGLLAANEVSANAIPSSAARAPDDKDPKCP